MMLATFIMICAGGCKPDFMVKHEMKALCLDTINTRLLSPRSKKVIRAEVTFRRPLEVLDRRGGFVEGEVDVENAYGVFVRHKFACLLAESNRGEWRVTMNTLY